MIKNSKLSIAESCFRGKSFLWFASSLNRRQKNKILLARISLLKKLQRLQQKNKNILFFEGLRNRKLLSLLYGGFSKRALISLKKKASQNLRLFSHSMTKNMLISLESRLDTCLFRMNFFSSFLQTRQQIKHSKVLINSKIVTACNYPVKPGDILSLNYEKSREGISQQLINYQQIKERVYKQKILNVKPQHLEVNYKTLTGIMLFPPQQLYLPAPNKLASYSDSHSPKGRFAPSARMEIHNAKNSSKRSRILNSFFRSTKKKSFKFFCPSLAVCSL